MNAYKVEWQDGDQPHIVAGRVLTVSGAKGKLLEKVKIQGKDKLVTMTGFHDSIKKAIDASACAMTYEVAFGRMNVWALWIYLNRLRRLARKLKKHGLLP